MIRFEFKGGTSNKFWQVVCSDCVLITTYGRVGTQGQTTHKPLPTPQKANAEQRRLIDEKLRKGYVHVGNVAAPAALGAAQAPAGAAQTPAGAAQAPAAAATQASAGASAQAPAAPSLAAAAPQQPCPPTAAAPTPPPPFKAPAFWTPQTFSAPQTHQGGALPLSALHALGAALSSASASALSHHATDAVAAVRAACTAPSLAAFAWDLFEAWLLAGAPTRHKWVLTALGMLGNDACARQITPLIRAWPGEAAHHRAVLALDVLAGIGSDVALMQLNGIAQKSKFKGLQRRAQEKMEEVAALRGLTAEDLADRLVPDLGLEDDGSKILDFGPRAFRVGFDESLIPFVVDAAGAPRKDLPKPNARDDAELAAAAVMTWKAMKKDARSLAALEILRLELAMSNQRRWPPENFQAFLVHHPLLTHLVRRLVWGAFSPAGDLLQTFRVAEDGSYASVDDITYELPEQLHVGVVHPIFLSQSEKEAWTDVFRDYALCQPFAQLSRSTLDLAPHERQGQALQRFVGRKVESKRVVGLQGRGWRRGTPQDAGAIMWFYKPITPHWNAGVQLDWLIIGSPDYMNETVTLGVVDFGPGEPDCEKARPQATPLAQVPASIMSEVLRDLEALGRVDGVEERA